MPPFVRRSTHRTPTRPPTGQSGALPCEARSLRVPFLVFVTLGNRAEEPFDCITFIMLGTKAGEIPAEKVRTRLAVVDASVEHFVAEPPLSIFPVGSSP
jgi:hypothetical protein